MSTTWLLGFLLPTLVLVVGLWVGWRRRTIGQLEPLLVQVRVFCSDSINKGGPYAQDFMNTWGPIKRRIEEIHLPWRVREPVVALRECMDRAFPIAPNRYARIGNPADLRVQPEYAGIETKRGEAADVCRECDELAKSALTKLSRLI